MFYLVLAAIALHQPLNPMQQSGKLMEANNTWTRYTIHQGGTGSGKTYSILQYLGDYGIQNENATLTITVAAESLPHLKRGAIRDFRNITRTENWPYKENRTDHTFTHNNITIEFVSASEPDKMRGARRDMLYINECNRVPYYSFEQMDMRTKQRTFLDFNPTHSFWVHEELVPTLTQPEYTFTKSTYLDNAHLLDTERQSIERRKGNANWWKVYGLGEIGSHEGLVFNNWEIAASPGPSEGGDSEVPLSGGLRGALIGYGIDFGFTHSPTVIVQLNEADGELYADELLYKTGIHNHEIFEFAEKHLDLTRLAVADSADTKTIDFLKRAGWSGLRPAIKGADSVLFGIDQLAQRKINVTPRSTNLIKELRTYMWDTEKDGQYTNTPIKRYDHAIDAMRYLYSYPEKKRIRIS